MKETCVFLIVSFFEKRKITHEVIFYCLLFEEVSFMKISWKPKIHKISSVFQKVYYCHFTMAFKSHTAAIRKQDIPVRGQPNPLLELALQLHDLMVNNPLFYTSVLQNVSQCQCIVVYEFHASCRWGNRACLLDDSNIHGCSQLCSCITQCVSVCLVLEANLLGLAEGSH